MRAYYHKKKRESQPYYAKRAEVRQALEDSAIVEHKVLEGVYDVVVIDPPWPVAFQAREARPNQIALAYQTMSLEAIRALVLPLADTARRCEPRVAVLVHKPADLFGRGLHRLIPGLGGLVPGLEGRGDLPGREQRGIDELLAEINQFLSRRLQFLIEGVEVVGFRGFGGWHPSSPFLAVPPMPRQRGGGVVEPPWLL